VISGQLTPAAAATEWIKEMNDSKAKNS
jgi:hypothetical protein